MITRRHLMGASAALAGAAAVGDLRPAMAQPRNLGPNRLVLLGTRGGPRITEYKQTPAANLIVWNNVPYVIDTGYGATFKLVEMKFPLPALRYTFITHHHSDHNAEFGLLVYNAWATGLQTPVDAYGPAGMKQLAQGDRVWQSKETASQPTKRKKAQTTKAAPLPEFVEPMKAKLAS